jgi:hypothetical protein
MNPQTTAETASRDLLVIELLATQDQRRTVSVAGHHQWRESIASARPFDEIDREIDEDFDDLIEIDPYVTGTNNRRSDRDLAKMLELIDNLPISENGKEGSH